MITSERPGLGQHRVGDPNRTVWSVFTSRVSARARS